MFCLFEYGFRLNLVLRGENVKLSAGLVVAHSCPILVLSVKIQIYCATACLCVVVAVVIDISKGQAVQAAHL